MPGLGNGSTPAGESNGSTIGAIVASEFSTDMLPTDDRFPFWKEVVCDTVANVEITRSQAGPFRGAIRWRGLELGAGERVELTEVTSTAQIATRGRRQVSRERDARLLICLQIGGRARIRQAGQDDIVAPGDLFLLDCTQPSQVIFEDPLDQLIIRVPHARLTSRLRDLEPFLGRSLRSSSPACGLITQHLVALARSLESIDAAARPGFIENAIDLVALGIAGERGFGGSGGTVRRAHILRAMQFIERSLGDPALSAARIAEALNISVGYLQHAFQETGTTVGTYIRDRRLERCRDDLVNPLCAAEYVAQIALRWGFRDMPHFSRAFRRRFGRAPRELRALVTRAVAERP